MKKYLMATILTAFLCVTAGDTVYAAEPVRTECNESVFTNTSSNIRVQPSTSAEKVGTVPRDTELTRTAVLDNGWSEISYNGNICYISSRLVTPKQPVAAEAVANTEAASPNALTAQTGIGETRTIQDLTYVCRGTSPGGLKLFYLDYDNGGQWPDWLISAYDSCGITNEMSDYDKCVAFNNYICRVVDYESTVGSSTEILTAECLKTGKANCVGFANAFDALCTMSGIYSVVVGSETHDWNKVIINGTEYWVDVTANDACNNAYLMSTSLWNDSDHAINRTVH